MRSPALLAAALVIAAVVVALPARADGTDYFAHSGESSSVKVRTPKARTPGQRALIWGLVGVGAISLGVGVYFNLDSHSAATEVSAQHDTIIGVWNDDRQATYDRARSSGVKAIVGYSVAGACALGALVATILTRPGEQVTEMRPRTILAPTKGGAVVSHVWSW
jgi:hypothetical protein